MAQQVISDGWKNSVAAQLSTALGNRFWAAVPRRQRNQPSCRALAALADAMESAVDEAHDAIGSMAYHGLGWLGRSRLERRVSEAFAKKVSLPGQDSIPPVVEALRIVGVWVCSNAGRDVVTQR